MLNVFPFTVSLKTIKRVSSVRLTLKYTNSGGVVSSVNPST